MTHFNHEWDTTKTPAVPMSVGDRYYAQDLNDDFNYLKHLPYEVFLQGRSRGVMVTPSDTWIDTNNSLMLSGGFGVILQDCIELDPDADFVIPPKTHPSPRYERIPFVDTTLTLPNDGIPRYIVATPTKRSLLQRTKALFTEQYASRVRYDGIITIQNFAPTKGQILVGICQAKEYCLLTDINPNQCKDNIILEKWFGQNSIGSISGMLQSYYNTTIDSIETKISIDTSISGIANGTFNNCVINIDTVNGKGINTNNTFNNCVINIGTVNNKSVGLEGSVFNHCVINIGTVNDNGVGTHGSIFNNCDIRIATVNNMGNGTKGSSFHSCDIRITTVNSYGNGINDSAFNNCIIAINTVNDNGYGIESGAFRNCVIAINTVNGNSRGIQNIGLVYLYLTCISCATVTNLSNTGGKLNVLNDTVLHAS